MWHQQDDQRTTPQVPNFTKNRGKMWPAPTSAQQKLYGDVQKPQPTTDYLKKYTEKEEGEEGLRIIDLNYAQYTT